jgi:phage gpG-like protein
MSVTGDFAELAALNKQLADLTLKHKLLTAASAEGLTQVQMGFRDQRDPFGKAWAPLKYRKGTKGKRAQILRLTGRMGNSFTSTPTENGFQVGSNTEYTKYHQEGTGGRKQAETRSMVRPVVGDAIQAGKLGSVKGRFISRKKARTLKYVAVMSMTATYAQGSGAIPIRMMVPPSGPDLPPIWHRAIEAACNQAFVKHFAGAR